MEQPLSFSMLENKLSLRQVFGQSVDFYTKDIKICGYDCCICMLEGLSSIERLWVMMLDAAERIPQRPDTPEALWELLHTGTAIPLETKPITCLADAQAQITAGTSVILIDGVDKALVLSTQNMQFRSVNEPSGEGNIRGSREGFTEPIRVNFSLIRRLVRSDSLRIETLTGGTLTQTEIGICYDSKLCSPKLLRHVRQRLQNLPLPTIFDSSYLAPFLGRKGGFCFFAGIGYTERPDRAAAKICEGKVVVLVNGSPFAMILPWLFYENFQSMDDYSSKAYFASFVRLLKYAAFFLAVLLPGAFVSIAGFTPELLPPQLLYKVAAAEQATPMPLFLEALFVNFLLEIVREAGLRLPKPVGHSVSLVAALIIGDAAIKAGILGTPIVIVAALTTLCGFVVPSLYEPITVLRLLFILAGGLLGPAGMLALFFWMLLDVSGMNAFGIPFLTPLTPAKPHAWRDVLVRFSLPKLARRPFCMADLSDDESQDEQQKEDPHAS